MIFVTLATLAFMTRPSSLCERCRVHSVAVCLLWIPAHVIWHFKAELFVVYTDACVTVSL